jgi:hypothetical protein
VPAAASWATDAGEYAALPASAGSGWQWAAQSEGWPGCWCFCPGRCSCSLCSPSERFLGNEE